MWADARPRAAARMSRCCVSAVVAVVVAVTHLKMGRKRVRRDGRLVWNERECQTTLTDGIHGGFVSSWGEGHRPGRSRESCSMASTPPKSTKEGPWLPSRTMHQTIRTHLTPGVRPTWLLAVRGSRALTMQARLKLGHMVGLAEFSAIRAAGNRRKSEPVVGLTAASFDRKRSSNLAKLLLCGLLWPVCVNRTCQHPGE